MQGGECSVGSSVAVILLVCHYFSLVVSPFKRKACLRYRLHCCAAYLCQQTYLLWVLVEAMTLPRQKDFGEMGQLPILSMCWAKNLLLSSNNFPVGAYMSVCACQVLCQLQHKAIFPFPVPEMCKLKRTCIILVRTYFGSYTFSPAQGKTIMKNIF